MSSLPEAIKARCTGTGVYVAGTYVTIVDCYMQAGFRYYIDDCGTAHREQDLEFIAAKSKECT